MKRTGPHIYVAVHCRVGSLEIDSFDGFYDGVVHCRVGSLEIRQFLTELEGGVHCRVGSLEMPLRA